MSNDPNTFTFKLDGKAARWPERLNDTELTFQLPAPFEAMPENLAGTFENLDALNHFMTVGVRNALINELAGWLKATPDGADKARSETATPAEVQEFAKTCQVTPPARRSGGKAAKLADAERRARENEQQAEALSGALHALLSSMAPAARKSAIAGLIEAGQLPAGFTFNDK
jgi:hypothetical protein